MSKYVGGLPTLRAHQPVNPDAMSDEFNKAGEKYIQNKKLEAAQKVVNDANATPIQKAMALASIGQEKLGSDVYKQSAKSANISSIDQALDAALQSARGGGSGAPNVAGATAPIRENTPAPTTSFTPTAPTRAASNAITAQMMQGVDQNYNPYAQNQEPQNVTQPNTNTQPQQVRPEAPPVVQVSPEEQEIGYLNAEADAFDKAAAQYADVNPTQSRNYKDTANNKRNQVEKIKQRMFENQKQVNKFSQDQRMKDVDAIRKDIKPYTNTEELSKNVKDLERVVELIDSGKVSLDDNYMRNFAGALLGDSRYPVLQELLKTPEQQELFSLTRKSLKPKQEGGSNPSTKEVLLSISSIPNPYKGKRANRFIAENLLNEAIIQEEKSKAMKRFAQDKDLSYEEWLDKVDSFIAPMKEQLDSKLQRKYKIENAKEQIAGKSPRSGKVFVMSPEGVVGEIDRSQLNAALSSEGELLR
jgi:hypothetical protein